MTSRRKFLVLGVGSAGALVLATLFRRSPSVSERSLEVEEVFMRAAEVLLPHAPGFPSLEETGVRQAFREIFDLLSRTEQRDIVRLTQLLDSPMHQAYQGLRFRRFTTLDEYDRLKLMGLWEKHPRTLFRQGFLGLRSLAMAAYYQSPLTWSAVGYGGPPIGLGAPISGLK